MEKTIHKLIIMYTERNDDAAAAAEELAAIDEVVDLILLMVTAIQDRISVDFVAAPAIKHVLFNDQSTQTSDVPEPVLETRDESVMVIDGEDLQDHRPTTVEDSPTACNSDGGKNDHEDLPAEGVVETEAPMVEDLAAVEPDFTKIVLR